MTHQWAAAPAPRHQMLMFSQSLDDAIAPDHAVRALDRVLSRMDWGDWEKRYDGRRGQPPIHPRLVAGAILYGLIKGLQSTRALEDATQNRLDFMWFLERRTIDHSTFADFRKRFKAELKGLNQRISREICRDAANALLELVIDGTRIRANSDRHGARTGAGLERLMGAVERELNEKLERLRDEAGELDLKKADAESLRKEVENLRGRMGQYEKALAVARKRDEAKRKNEGKKCHGVRVPVTDPDSMLAPNKEGGFAPNYTPVVAVDRATGAIIMGDVVEEANEGAAVALAVEAAADLSETKPARIVADTSFATGGNLEFLEGENIEAYMPTGTDFRPSNPANRPDPTQAVAPELWDRLPRHGGLLARSAFVFDEEKNQYYCPLGQPMRKTVKSGGKDIRYACSGKADCPLAGQCVKGQAQRRTIRRDEYQSLRDQVGRRMAGEEGRAIYKKRAPVVEGVFGVIKSAMRIRRFLLRGLANVRTEWAWICAALNLKKLLRLAGTAASGAARQQEAIASRVAGFAGEIAAGVAA
jgi:transposase